MVLHLADAPGIHEACGGGQLELRPIGNSVFGDPREHLVQSRAVHGDRQRQCLRHEEPTEQCPVTGIGSMLECLERKVLVGVPLRSPAVQLEHRSRLLDEEAMPQHV
ncbi:MAG: hypothetical protein K0R30_2958 [Ornithinibacter sp.]|nr:hypothetical protein [Ornithinibacter sp.]